VSHGDSKIAAMNRPNSSVLSRLLNWNADAEERTTRQLHVDAAAVWKDRSPMMELFVRGTIGSVDDAERNPESLKFPLRHQTKHGFPEC